MKSFFADSGYRISYITICNCFRNFQFAFTVQLNQQPSNLNFILSSDAIGKITVIECLANICRHRHINLGLPVQRRQSCRSVLITGNIKLFGFLVGKLFLCFINGFQPFFDFPGILTSNFFSARQRVDHILYRADMADIATGGSLLSRDIAAAFVMLPLFVRAVPFLCDTAAFLAA